MTKVSINEVRLAWSPTMQAFEPRKPSNPTARFVKGPIPLVWIGTAARLPGKTLHVALALQYLAGLTQSNTVKLTARTLDIVGVARDAKAEALSRLQLAGLISVEQSPGRAPSVTLLSVREGAVKGGRHDR